MMDFDSVEQSEMEAIRKVQPQPGPNPNPDPNCSPG